MTTPILAPLQGSYNHPTAIIGLQFYDAASAADLAIVHIVAPAIISTIAI